MGINPSGHVFLVRTAWYQPALRSRLWFALQPLASARALGADGLQSPTVSKRAEKINLGKKKSKLGSEKKKKTYIKLCQ